MSLFSIEERVPSVAIYRTLRGAAGMTDRSPAAAAIGLAATLYGVMAYTDERAIGMARVIGDGGCFFQICDVAVAADWQRQGIGDALMCRVTAWLNNNADPSAFVSLLADGVSDRLYRRHGFEYSAPASQGMVYPRRLRGGR